MLSGSTLGAHPATGNHRARVSAIPPAAPRVGPTGRLPGRSPGPDAGPDAGPSRQVRVIGIVGAETSITAAPAAAGAARSVSTTRAFSADSSALPHSTRWPSASSRLTVSSLAADAP